MRYIHTFIKDCNYDGRVSCCKFPRLLNIYISTFDELGRTQITFIHQMPLLHKKRVIESSSGCHCCIFLKPFKAKRIRFVIRSPLKNAVIFHTAHFTESREVRSDLFYRMLITETYDVPKMKSLLACLFFRTKINRKNSLYMISVNKVENLIDTEDS